MSMRLDFEVSSFGNPQVLINETCFKLGDDLTGRFGFDECQLDYDILCIILALALRKQGDPHVWMDAEELGVLARAGATGSSTAKRLELALSANLRPGSGPRLIEFWQSQPEGRFRGGRSRGPYRLGRDVDVSSFDAATALATLSGSTDPRRPRYEGDDYSNLARAARSSFNDGNYVNSKEMADAALSMLHRGPLVSSGQEQVFALAETYVLIANIDLELGRSKQGLHAARVAQRLFDRVRHPAGFGYALQVESHLHGQLEDPESAARSVAAAKRAVLQLDNGPRSHRRGISRSICSGTLGWRLAMAGKSGPAARRLHSALRMAQDSHSEAWTGIWSFRIAQNEILRGNLVCAENYIGLALEHQGSMGISATAALARAATEFCIAAGCLDDAQRWLMKAQSIGQSRSMSHQKRLVDRLVTRLASLRRS